MKIFQKGFGVLVILALLLLASASAFAQEGEATISAKQQSLNDRAVRLIIEEDHAAAVALLEESVVLGPINVTYLNLGRAYQAMGKCDRAREALNNALDAPKVADPSPAFIQKRVDSALAELDEQCEDEEPAATTKQGEQTEQTEPNSVPLNPPAETSNTLEWAAIGTGSAMLVASGVFYMLAESKAAEITDTPPGEVSPLTRTEATEIADSAATYRTTSLGLAIGGAAVAGVGAVLLLTDSPDEGASVSFGPDSVRVDWRVSF